MIRNRYPKIRETEFRTKDGPVWGPGSRMCVQILAAMLCLAAVLQAEDVKKIPTEEAMSALVSKVVPEYPALAKQLKLSGQVEVEANIDEDGSVGDVTTVSGNPVLAKAVVDAVKKWKFKPFKSKVSSKFTIGFRGTN
jgi:TonB family protein